jgi:uncharacterized membrane protein
MNAEVPNSSSARALPRTIPDYLAQLREALRGADPALIQDALYDAEEYLRSELAERKGEDEASVIASVAGSYGNPEEVADIYRDTETTVVTALRTPRPPPRASALGKFFGVVADPRTYTSMFYMLLSLATGIFYFTWVVTGMSLSLGLAVLIIGLPFLVLFFASVRLLSVVEGRIIEVMLGERMPRRPAQLVHVGVHAADVANRYRLFHLGGERAVGGDLVHRRTLRLVLWWTPGHDHRHLHRCRPQLALTPAVSAGHRAAVRLHARCARDRPSAWAARQASAGAVGRGLKSRTAVCRDDYGMA